MSDFEEFWSAYPRKKAKGAARAAYEKALKKTTHEMVMEGVRLYNAEILRKGTEPQFIAHPSTWLNQERWDDEYDVDTEQQKRRSAIAGAFADQFDADQSASPGDEAGPYLKLVESTG